MLGMRETLDDILNTMTPEIHQQLKTAIELGRWQNGDRLTSEQQGLCLQAVIAYDQKHVNPSERVGFIERKKQSCETNTNSINKKEKN